MASEIILLIEDNYNTARMMTRLLEKNGYTVLHATDGATGLQLTENYLPHLILLDLGLPDMDGQSVAAYIRQSTRLRDIPIIVVTAWPFDTARQMAAAYNCQGYIAQPIDTHLFPQQIAEFLGGVSSS